MADKLAVSHDLGICILGNLIAPMVFTFLKVNQPIPRHEIQVLGPKVTRTEISIGNAGVRSLR